MAERGERPDPNTEDIMAGDRRISRPDASLPDWEVPDSAYRPIPIVWFTGAMVGQIAVLFALLWLLPYVPGLVIVGAAGIATGLIAAWTWARGMAGAAQGWRIATGVVLALQLGLVLLAVINTQV
ncbi:hypothetical protein [Erythrobacter sp.]|jgi:hypothetical protein|uniref:hypothetical protein n=1 Tax=Erythrobacter sp. TaxID=1042 RepID=UPI002EC15FE8|nr:hypothetical protein [Erythrobacter sp.]